MGIIPIPKDVLEKALLLTAGTERNRFLEQEAFKQFPDKENIEFRTEVFCSWVNFVIKEDRRRKKGAE